MPLRFAFIFSKWPETITKRKKYFIDNRQTLKNFTLKIKLTFTEEHDFN